MAIHVAAVLYRDIGRRLLRVHDGDPMHGRTMVSQARRVFGVVWGVASALHPVSWGLGAHANEHPPIHAHLHGLGGAPIEAAA
jgi:hypothetical protein